MSHIVHSITVQLVDNGFGDQDIRVDDTGMRLHEAVGLLELAKDALLEQHR